MTTLTAAKSLREVKDELNEAQELIVELRQERKLLRDKLRDLMVDHRALLADVKAKNRKIDALEAEARR